MTVLALRRNRFLPLERATSRPSQVSSFAVFNKKGFITIALLGIVGGAVAAYLAAMYWSFNLRMVLRDNVQIVQSLTEQFARDVVALEARSAKVREEIESRPDLEKISSIRYLDANSLTAYVPFPNR